MKFPFTWFRKKQQRSNIPVWKESQSTWNHSPPSIDQHGVCRDDSLNLITQAGLWLLRTNIPKLHLRIRIIVPRFSAAIYSVTGYVLIKFHCFSDYENWGTFYLCYISLIPLKKYTQAEEWSVWWHISRCFHHHTWTCLKQILHP